MVKKVVKVEYVNVKNNFCYLNSSVIKEIGINETIRIEYGSNKQAYFTLSDSLTNFTDNVIALNSLYAKLLGIEENSEVLIESLNISNKVESFSISPLRSEDFMILDLLKNEIENKFLLQAKIVVENQCMIIWTGENLYFPVKLVSVKPCSPGILCNLTELIILPHVNQSNSEECVVENSESSEVKSLTTDIFEISKKLIERENQNGRKFRAYTKKRPSFYGRIVPYDKEKLKEFSKYFYEFSVFASKIDMHPEYRDIDSFEIPIFCSLQLMNNFESEKIYVRIFLIEEETFLFPNNIYANEKLLRLLGCKIGAKVKLTRIFENLADLIIIVRKNKEENVKDLFKEYLAEICQTQEFILNENIPISINERTQVCLKFKPDFHKYCCIDSDFLRNVQFKVEDNPFAFKQKEQQPCEQFVETKFVEIESLQSIRKEIMEKIARNLRVTRVKFENFLITGKHGVGKTILIKMLSDSLSQTPFFLHSEIIKCKTLKGKTLDSLHKVLISIFENLIKHQPSILFLDDLEILCEKIDESNVQDQNALYFNRISEMVFLLLKWLSLFSSVGIIATTNSSEKLNPNLYSSRGCYLFDNISNIKDLIKEDRLKILKHFLNEHSCEFNLEILSTKSEGYVFQDLHDLTRKIIFEAIKDGSETIRDVHVEKASSQMTILSLVDVKFNSPGDKDFSNVGGSADVKKLLIENLLWPIKYSSLFNTSPLRLQSGMLLYGPPGTGKTLLAAAAAKQCGIRLISIKGPELLSKYIGASEQAVRDVFTRAQNAKPCILFFDEFDSLAPRRGHDITGVTDRVVNQFLTQLDGVESLNGVFVLAATSRPDLLDPALLRPGRLDKQILCPLPDKDARMDILRILSKDMQMDHDVDLNEIAESTDGYSGADLQSVLYNAQLSTMEHLLLLAEDNKKVSEDIQPITREILKKSLLKTRPSLTKDESRKYDRIYSKFRGGSNSEVLKHGTKASLA